MQLFITVLTERDYIPAILKELADNHFHGSVLSTRSIKHALMDSVEPDPYFGGLSKVVNDDQEEDSRPMIFTVIKDEEVDQLRTIVHKAVNGINGKGFMYTLPINFVEGLDA